MIFIDAKGVRVPALGFGTWQLTGPACERAVRAALDIGYRHIDTASMYGNEEAVGAAIRGSGIDRSEIFLTTKVWSDAVAYAAAKRSCEESLRLLGTDYVDLLLIHWPAPGMAETLRAFAELRGEGKVRSIGVSNYDVRLMREAIEVHGADLLWNQLELHALQPQREVLAFARRHGLVVTAHRPLARGRLAAHPVLRRIGQHHGKNASQVALRWIVEQDGVAAIPKAGSEGHAKANFAIFDFALAAEERAEIDALA